ncbi:MAG: HAD family hydrolase [Alphaproteobacteria bacterium]
MLPDDGRLPSSGKVRAVFLDRDGVINRSEVVDGKPYAPRELSRFRLLPGVRSAVARLKEAGFRVIVVTNQPDIGNGLVSRSTVDAMNRIVRSRVGVDDVKMCPHSQRSGCECRKPGISLLLEAAEEWGLDLSASYFVGDRESDIVSGRRAGCYTVFVDRGYLEKVDEAPDARASSLPQSVAIILRHSRQLKGCDQ